MVIFHSYVNLPEGKCYLIWICRLGCQSVFPRFWCFFMVDCGVNEHRYGKNNMNWLEGTDLYLDLLKIILYDIFLVPMANQSKTKIGGASTRIIWFFGGWSKSKCINMMYFHLDWWVPHAFFTHFLGLFVGSGLGNPSLERELVRRIICKMALPSGYD